MNASINIKTLANEIGCSTQPIVWHFDNMENYAESTIVRVNIINRLFDIYKVISNVMLAFGTDL